MRKNVYINIFSIKKVVTIWVCVAIRGVFGDPTV